jgi:hypothetical protein
MTLIYLYVILITNGGRDMIRTPHPTYSSCFAALDHAKHSPAPADSRTVVMFCGDERMEWAYSGEWHRYSDAK